MAGQHEGCKVRWRRMDVEGRHKGEGHYAKVREAGVHEE